MQSDECEACQRVRSFVDEVERLRAENEAALEYDKSMRRQLSELKDCSGSASSERAWLALEEWEQQNPKPQATEAPPEPIKG